jgi:hypothetical protein
MVRAFTKAQQRYIRCRLKKKLRLLDEESRNAAAALLQRGCNAPNSLVIEIEMLKVVLFLVSRKQQSNNSS